jgi:hypothetical protein
MVSGKNHIVPPNVFLAQPVPIQVMSCGIAAGAVARREKWSKFE